MQSLSTVSIHQSIHQSRMMHQSVNPSINQSINQSITARALFDRFHDDLTSRNSQARHKSAIELRSIIESILRDMNQSINTSTSQSTNPMSNQALNFLQGVTTCVLSYIKSDDMHHMLAGIAVIDELIEMRIDQSETLIIHAATAFRLLFHRSHTTDPAVLNKAAKALGHLARVGLTTGGGAVTTNIGNAVSLTLTEELVDFQMNEAFEWLSSSNQPARHLAAVLILKELAQSTPALFNVYVHRFLEHVWAAIHSQYVEVREAAIVALRVCLIDIQRRSSPWKQQCYEQIAATACATFSARKNPSHVVHGSLLVLGELLAASGDFLYPRYETVCEIILKHRDSSNALIVRTVISLIPRLASLNRDRFVSDHLQSCLVYIMHQIDSDNRDSAYLALGHLALSVGSDMAATQLDLDVIIEKVAQGLSKAPNSKSNHYSLIPLLNRPVQRSRQRDYCDTALTCCGMLARALGIRLLPQLPHLTDLMFETGLSLTLIDALRDITTHVEPLLTSIQSRLLELIASILSRSIADINNARNRSVITTNDGSNETSVARGTSKSLNSPVLILALKTLSTFDMTGQDLYLLALIRDVVSHFLTLESPLIRREASLTIARCLSSLASRVRNGKQGELVFDLLRRLVVVAVADPIPVIRLTVLSSLDSRLDAFLAQADCLVALFVALNDEVYAIRELTVALLGRLSPRNPSLIQPTLRRTLIALLTSLEQSRGDSAFQEESSRLLAQLIGTCHLLIKPYVLPILRVLVPKLSTSVGIHVLSTLGALSTIGGDDVLAHIDGLIPLIVHTLQDKSSHIKRQVALHTLAQILSSTGYVLAPTLKHPKLLPCVLKQLQVERNATVRLEVLKVLGIIGAIDPLRYKELLALSEVDPSVTVSITERPSPDDMDEGMGKKHMHSLHSQHVLVQGQLPPVKTITQPINMSLNRAANLQTNQFDRTVDPAAELAQSAKYRITDDSGQSAHEEYFPIIAIAALLRVLNDSRLAQHHHMVIKAMMFIYQTLGAKSAIFLPYVLPALFEQIRVGESTMREQFFQHLGGIIKIVRSAIRPYVERSMEIIGEFWPELELLPSILNVIEQLVLALGPEFHGHLNQLVPRLVGILQNDQSITRTPINRTLHALRVMCSKGSYNESLPVLLPCLVRLCEIDQLSESTRQSSLETIALISRFHDVTDHASRMIHPFARILSIEPINSPLIDPLVRVIGILIQQLDASFLLFEPMISAIINKRRDEMINQSINQVVAGPITESREITRYRMILARLMDSMKANQSINRSPNQSTDIWEDLNDPLDQTINHSPTQFEDKADAAPQVKKLSVNQASLARSWTVTHRSTKDDWLVWLRGFSIELLKESPSSALRVCSPLAQKYPPLARELFNAAFLSCWTELYAARQAQLIDALTSVFKARSVGSEIHQSLLNLAEYMDHHDQPMPIDASTLGTLAERCHAFAKALHYKEAEFKEAQKKAANSQSTNPSTNPSVNPANNQPVHQSPNVSIQQSPVASTNQSSAPATNHSVSQSASQYSTVEALISINNKLNQFDAAHGVLKIAEIHQWPIEVSWYEKLHRWEEALEAYQKKEQSINQSVSQSIYQPSSLTNGQSFNRSLEHDVRTIIGSLDHANNQSGNQTNGLVKPNQSINPPTNHSINQSNTQSINLDNDWDDDSDNDMTVSLLHHDQPVNQSITKSVRKSINRSSSDDGELIVSSSKYHPPRLSIDTTNQSIDRSIIPPVNQSLIKQTTHQSVNQSKSSISRSMVELSVGQMRCLRALGEHDRLFNLSINLWNQSIDQSTKRLIAPLACSAACGLMDWESLNQFLPSIDDRSFDRYFYTAIYQVHQCDSQQAIESINRCCELIDGSLTALVGESYQRAYRSIVQLQQLMELTEVLQYKEALQSINRSGTQALPPSNASSLNQSISQSFNQSINPSIAVERIDCIKKAWKNRLMHCQRDVEVWQEILMIRSLVMNPSINQSLSASIHPSINPSIYQSINQSINQSDDQLTYLEFASLCRKQGKLHLSLKTIHQLMGFSPMQLIDQSVSHCLTQFSNQSVTQSVNQPHVMLAAIQHVHAAGHHLEAVSRLIELVDAPVFQPIVHTMSHTMNQSTNQSINQSVNQSTPVHTGSPGPSPRTPTSSTNQSVNQSPNQSPDQSDLSKLLSRCYLKLGEWQLQLMDSQHDHQSVNQSTNQSNTQSNNLANSPSLLASRSFSRVPSINQPTSQSNQSTPNSVTHSINQPISRVQTNQSTPSSMNQSASRVPSIMNAFELATKFDTVNHKAWHEWSMINFRVVSQYNQSINQSINQSTGQTVDQSNPPLAHVAAAIHGFFRSLYLLGNPSTNQSINQAVNPSINPSLNPSTNQSINHSNTQSVHELGRQDVLRILQLWFEYGHHESINQSISQGINECNLDTWLSVIPQLIARIHQSNPIIRNQLMDLLIRIGQFHPQALVYPLSVASKSMNQNRQLAALTVFQSMRAKNHELTHQSLLVSNELVRIAILWREQWHEVIEEASRHWFVHRCAEDMLAVLQPMHQLMDRGPQTTNEMQFHQAFYADLQDAYDLLLQYFQSRRESEMERCWMLYSSVFKKISKQPSLVELDLSDVSPRLMQARDLTLAVPGSYRANQPITSISYFQPTLRVIESKQHPRKLSIIGNDGLAYLFLLKGHEDLRQDERCMQLFGLVNGLLSADRSTRPYDCVIRRYEVIPLSPQSGLIEWVPHCDPVHHVIKQYREARTIPLNLEQRLISERASERNYPLCTLLQKLEVFEYALSKSDGSDLAKVFWFKSPNAEIWLERRTNFTRSLAVMSMVGYILGLGDRHTCNLMLDRRSGEIVHIDFGDCFEVAQHRDKYPERVPFRLTRMFVGAMEVSGIEGTFRSISQRVMHVMRKNKNSVMALLEAFIYDPLINWRLVESSKKTTLPDQSINQSVTNAITDTINHSLTHSTNNQSIHPPNSPPALDRRRSIVQEIQDSPHPRIQAGEREHLNEKALQVIARVESKLKGLDHGDATLDVNQQVDRLIQQATSNLNLCQLYIGWCPFW